MYTVENCHHKARNEIEYKLVREEVNAVEL